MTLPETTTPEDLARHMGWSERRVRDLARRLGACRIFGNRMALTKDDVDAILEASRPCPLRSTSALAEGLMAKSAEVMNAVLGENKVVQKVTTQ